VREWVGVGVCQVGGLTLHVTEDRCGGKWLVCMREGAIRYCVLSILNPHAYACMHGCRPVLGVPLCPCMQATTMPGALGLEDDMSLAMVVLPHHANSQVVRGEQPGELRVINTVPLRKWDYILVAGSFATQQPWLGGSSAMPITVTCRPNIVAAMRAKMAVIAFVMDAAGGDEEVASRTAQQQFAARSATRRAE
jgi:hypothetical protein